MIFAILNGTALMGWSFILILLLSITFHVELLAAILPKPFPLALLYILEGICLVEVGRIASGHLQGNLILGLVLHAIRLTCLAYILSDGLQLLLTTLPEPTYEDSEKRRIILQTSLILYSWSITEVCRYPMYLFPSSETTRKIRLVVPILTFPVGCALEAYGAFRVVRPRLFGGGGGGASSGYDNVNNDDIIAAMSWAKYVLLWTVILINGLLGPALAYPAILRKGLPVLMGKKSVMRKKSKGE